MIKGGFILEIPSNEKNSPGICYLIFAFGISGRKKSPLPPKKKSKKPNPKALSANDQTFHLLFNLYCMLRF